MRWQPNLTTPSSTYAIARAAIANGDDVTLIAGPVNLETPAGVRRVDVVSARDMLKATREAAATVASLVISANEERAGKPMSTRAWLKCGRP